MKSWGMFLFTLKESVRRGTLIFYAGVATLIMILFALGISHPADNPESVTMFGAPMTTPPGMVGSVAGFVLSILHRQSVFWLVVFGVFGTASLIPSFLEKGTAELFLSKPLTRAHLLLSRSAGAVAGISVNILYFTLGIWLIFGLKAGYWSTGLLLSAVALAFTFFCYFSVVTFVGLIMRSGGLTIMLALAFSLISWGLETRAVGLYLLWGNEIYHRVLDGLYYLLPQVNAMLTQSSVLVGPLPFIPSEATFTMAPFLWSAGSSALLYALAVWYFSRQDY